jgi:hypothetical protein
MKKILIALALGSASMFATSTCSGPDSSGSGVGSFVMIYSGVALGPSTVLTPDSADSCSIGSYVFSNFQVAGGAGDNFTAGPTTGFTLDAIVSAAGTLEFSFTNLGGGDIELYYTITSGVPNMLLQAGTTSSVSEVICATAFTAPNSTCGGTPLNLTTPFGVTSLNPSSLTLVTPANEDFVVKDITGGSEIFQTIIPEPMTLSLMGIGLVGIGFFGRKLRK